MPDLPLTPFPMFECCDYDGCVWSIVSVDHEMSGWSVAVRDRQGTTELYPFELGQAGKLSKSKLTINPYVVLPSVPAWLAFVGRSQVVRVVDPDGVEFVPATERV